ncbi:acyl-CoA N-acyltransferase, partial [Amylostereum chailletii]
MERPLAPAHEIVVISQQDPDEQPALIQQCYDVRIEVFHHEQGFSLELEIDEMDATATHFLLRLLPSHTPIGTIRAFKAPGDAHYTLGRLAILKTYRKYRFGRELVLALHDFVQRDAR